MKKLLLLVLFISYTFNLHAIKLCRQGCFVPSGWRTGRTNDANIGGTRFPSLPSLPDYTGYDNVSWSLMGATGGSIGGVAKCTNSNSTSSAPSSSGVYCHCRVTTINDSSCDGASWVFLGGPDLLGISCQDGCAFACVVAAQAGGNGPTCTRAALVAMLPDVSTVSAVTCPESGTCTNSAYKTVANNESCDEVIGPTLTISGSYSNTNGTFIYTDCQAN